VILRSVAAYCTVAPSENEVRLVATPGMELKESPRIADRPLGVGSVLAVGRLGPKALNALLHTHVARKFSVRVKPGLDWVSLDIPRAKTYTCYDPDRGFAYLQWEGASLRARDFEAGQIQVRFPSGVSFSGTVAVTPVWLAGGRVRTGGEETVCLREVADSKKVQFNGLPPNIYSVELRGHWRGLPVVGEREGRRFLDADLRKSPSAVVWASPGDLSD